MGASNVANAFYQTDKLISWNLYKSMVTCPKSLMLYIVI